MREAPRAEQRGGPSSRKFASWSVQRALLTPKGQTTGYSFTAVVELKRPGGHGWRQGGLNSMPRCCLAGRPEAAATVCQWTGRGPSQHRRVDSGAHRTHAPRTHHAHHILTCSCSAVLCHCRSAACRQCSRTPAFSSPRAASVDVSSSLPVGANCLLSFIFLLLPFCCFFARAGFGRAPRAAPAQGDRQGRPRMPARGRSAHVST